MIAVTGLGVVSSLGASAEATWKRLARGDRGLRTIGLFDGTGQRGSLVAEVEGVDVPSSASIAWSRTAAFACTAAREALGGLDPKRSRVGLVIAGTTGGMLENELPISAFFPDPTEAQRDPARRSHPLSSTVDAVAFTIGPFARTRTLASACSGGASAIVIGAAWLLANQVDAVLVGGAESLCRLTLTGFNALGVIDPEPCRPFDRARRGLNLGEGAGFLLLERGEGARARGAEILAELAGWSLGSEAHHVTNPEPTGIVAGRVIASAISRAGLRPEDVDYVSAHGTGTPLNDKTESLAIARAFGEHTMKPAVSSNKAQIGHTLGAAAAIEAALAVMVLREGIVPPTAGLVDPDPECRLRHVRASERADVRVCVSNAFGFGGMDSALVLAKPGIAKRSDPPKRSLVVSAVSLGAGEIDPARSRRLDEPSRTSVGGAASAIEAAEASGAPLDRTRTGAVFGTAFGNVHGSSGFVHRILEKGPRFAPPADFPNLVPSASAGHASIYLGLGGPAMSTCDLGTSLEAAFATACDLVAADEADAVVCGVTVEKSTIITRVFAPLFSIAPPEPGPSLVVEAEHVRNGPVLARITAIDVVPFEEEKRLDAYVADSTFASLREAVVALASGEVRSARVVARRPLPWGSSGAFHVAVLVRP